MSIRLQPHRLPNVVLVLIASTGLISMMVPQSGMAQAAGQKIHLDIPAQDLSASLTQFGRETGTEIEFAPDVVREKKAVAVKGEFERDQALKLLLEGTGLTYHTTPQGAIVVEPSKPRAAKADKDQSSSTANQATQEPSDGLQEIVVTSQRREESVKKVPISITALNQQTMDDLQIQNVRDLATIMPGLALTPQVAVAQDSGDVAIRGIFSGGNSPTTELYIDETPVAIRQLGASLSKSPWHEIFDLDRVEVLRGPQGTLFGASAMGGAVRFITPQPSLADSSGFAKADVAYSQGGDPNYEIGAAYGAPIVPGTVGFRVSAWYQSEGGFIDRGDRLSGQILERNANGSDAYVIRPAVTWAPSEALSVTGAVFLQYTHSENGNSYWLNGLPSNEPSGHVWDAVDQPFTDDLRVASLSVKYGVEGVSFVSDTSYLDRTSYAVEDVSSLYLTIVKSLVGANTNDPFIAGLPSSFGVFEENHSSTRAWQQEFRLSSDASSSPVSWVAGAFYRRAVQNLYQLQPPDLTPATEALAGQTVEEVFGVPTYIYNGQALNAYDNYSTTDISEAVYGDVAWKLTQGLKLDVGLRYEHLIVQDQSQFATGPFNFGTINVTLPDEVANPVTPRVSLSQRYSDTGMVYVSAAKGDRPGGGNSANASIPLCGKSLAALGLTSAPATFNSDSLWSYELGVKDTLFDRRLSIDGSVYYIRWTGIQTPVTLPSCGNSFVENEGEAISRGFDLQLDAAVTSSLTLHTAVSYTDVYYPKALFGPPPVDGSGNPIGPPTLFHAAGDKVVNVIPWTISANARYTRNISSLWTDSRAYLQVDYRHLDGATGYDPRTTYYNIDPGADAHPNPAYGILNLRLGVIHSGLDMSAYVNNATRSDPVLGYYDSFGYAPSLHYASTLRPFTVGFTAWYRF
jgi:iron complex outermembrane recepter protein